MNKAITLAAAVMATALIGCGKSDHAAHEKAAKADNHEKHEKDGLVKMSDEELARSGVKTEALTAEQQTDTLTATAVVVANPERLAHVLPRLSGRVLSVQAKLGDRVRQGQTLAMLESTEAGESQSALAQASAEAAVAEAAFRRAERLAAEQVIPAKELQRARGDYEKTRAQLQAATDKLRMLGMAPSAEGKAGPRGVFPLVAPLGGAVIERKAVIGELAKTEESLFTVADLSTVWLEAQIPEAHLSRVRVGSAARASVSAYADEKFAGKVNHLGAVLDKETRTVKAIIHLDNVKGLLRPQMFASVAIATGGTRLVLAVPESAVTLIQGLPSVFVEEAAGFEARPVELGERFNGRVVVKSGVKAGELVAHEGVYALKARALKSQIGSGHAH